MSKSEIKMSNSKVIKLNSVEFFEQLEAANKKVERLEKAIWEFLHNEHSNSPEETQQYLNEIYAGVHDYQFDLAIAECKKDWE